LDIFNIIGSLFGYILWFFYMIVKNYGLAVILFTIVIKLILFPVSIKQQKSMAANARMSAKQAELKKKYGNDTKKLNEEVSKLYEKEGANPASGCFTMAIPMLLLLGVYYAVINPLTNTLHIAKETVTSALNNLTTLPGIGTSFTSAYGQIDIIKLAQDANGRDFLGGFFDSSTVNSIVDYSNGFNFCGLDLLGKPSDSFSILIIIPILCFLTALLSQLFTMKMQGGAMGGQQQQQGCMKVMMIAMPLFSAWIAYGVPAAVGFYWIISTVLGFAQTVVLNHFYNAGKMTAKQEAQRIALLEINEAKVQYEYIPSFDENDFEQDNSKNKNKGKKGKK